MCLAVVLTGGIAAAAAPSQTVDIEKTRLGGSDTYYSFYAWSKTLTISGSGATPNFTNSSDADTSQPWFSWRGDGSIKRIVIEEGVTALGDYIFTNNSAESVSFPTTLKKLGGSSFSGCSGLKELELAEVEEISGNAFSRCFGLEKAVIPETVSVIGESAFERCTSLQSLIFESPWMNVAIMQKAFLNCPALSRVTMPVGAALGKYCVGFSKAQAGEYYDDFVMSVYMDSDAYGYAVKNALKYELMGVMEIRPGVSVTRTYFTENLNDKMVFAFTPDSDGRYCFKSDGDVDVDCVLSESGGGEIAAAEDNSPYDLNFTIECTLEAGKQYYFTVSSNYSRGDYTVGLKKAAAYGDFNYDGYVNAKDYAIIRQNYGSYQPGDEALGSFDFNGDGIIDETDWGFAADNITVLGSGG